MGKIAGDFSPEKCRATCHAKQIFNRMAGRYITYYFCEGIIGPLTKEQVERYCY